MKLRGAALIIVLVLLSILGIVAGAALPQIIRNRQAIRMDLLRTQSHQLFADAIRCAEAKRESEPTFSGETFVVGSDIQPFPGSFHVATRLENDAFVAEVEYRNTSRTTIYNAVGNR